MNNKKILEEKLVNPKFQKRLRLASNFERLSGGGLLKKIKRIFIVPSVYLPYLFIVKFGLFWRKSVQAKLFWGREISLPLKDYDSLALYKYGFAGGTESELKLTKYLIKNLKESDVFYDIGANYGFFTYLAEELSSEVHTFEPNSELVEVLKTNTKENPAVFINAVALSDTAGQTELHMSESTGLSTINASTIKTHTYAYKKTRLVQTQTLDDYVATHTQPTFLKIDVEGAEEAVIRGGEALLGGHSPIVALEVWGKDNGGEVSMRAVDRLRALGYLSFSLTSEGDLEKADGDLSALAPSLGGDNFIFKKEPRQSL